MGEGLPNKSGVIGSIGFRDRASTWRSFLASDVCVVLVAALVSATCFFFVERVTVNDGFGWDGVLYANWARDFHEEILVKKVSPYYIQRILPSAIVGGVLRLLHVPLTDRAILAAFGVYAAALLTLAAACWCGISRALHLSVTGKWLGFVALFGNYLSLKYVFFVPPSTDACGYALGMVMLLAYLRRNTFLLVGAALAGAFCWPLCVHIGAIMLILRRPTCEVMAGERLPMGMRLVAAGALTGVIAIAFGIVLQRPITLQATAVMPIYIEPLRSTLALSVVISLAFILFSTYYLLGCFSFKELRSFVNMRSCLTIVAVIGGLFAIKYVQVQLARPEPEGANVYDVLLAQTLLTSVKLPGVFLVTHIALYGPIIILAVWFWKATCQEMSSAGPAITLCLLLGVVLGINSQSRFVLNIFPLLVPFVVKAVERSGFSRRQLISFTVASLLTSKVWFTINSGPFHGRLHEFPDQGFFMSHGPWISPTMYAVQGAMFIVVAVTLYMNGFSKQAVQRPSVDANYTSKPLRTSA